MDAVVQVIPVQTPQITPTLEATAGKEHLLLLLGLTRLGTSNNMFLDEDEIGDEFHDKLQEAQRSEESVYHGHQDAHPGDHLGVRHAVIAQVRDDKLHVFRDDQLHLVTTRGDAAEEEREDEKRR